MANCSNCQHRSREEVGHECKLWNIAVSLNSWCEKHEEKPVPRQQRISDNPRSAEDIHD